MVYLIRFVCVCAGKCTSVLGARPCRPGGIVTKICNSRLPVRVVMQVIYARLRCTMAVKVEHKSDKAAGKKRAIVLLT